LAPPSRETWTKHENCGVSTRLETTTFAGLAGLRASVGELWDLMSVRLPAPAFTGASPLSAFAVGGSSYAVDTSTAPAPTTRRETPMMTDSSWPDGNRFRIPPRFLPA